MVFIILIQLYSIGNIFYSFDRDHEPVVEYETIDSEDLYRNPLNIVTNPTGMQFINYDEDDVIRIHSGDRITEEYSCTY